MLKQAKINMNLEQYVPAAFGRLCVETIANLSIFIFLSIQPPSGGCVLKQDILRWVGVACPSRLRAAVC